MLKFYYKQIIVLIFILSISAVSENIAAQGYVEGNRGFFANWRLNANLGPGIFYGDIINTQSTLSLKDIRMSYGGILRKQVSPTFAFGLQLLKGRLHGTRLNFGGKDLMFDADYLEYNFNTTVDLFNFFGRSRPDRKFSIYGFAGIGLINWKSDVKDYNTGNLFSPPGINENPSKGTQSAIIVPLGMGMKFEFNHKFGLNLEGTVRTANTDYLDDWKSGFKYDMFAYTSVGLFYNLNALSRDRDPEKVRERYYEKRANEIEREQEPYSYRYRYENDSYRDYNYSNDRDQANRYVDDRDIREQKYREAQQYREEQKKFEEANRDLRYYNYNKNTRTPSTGNYRSVDYSGMPQQSGSSFWANYNRTEMPVVVEYDITGVYNRVSSSKPTEIIKKETPEIKTATMQDIYGDLTDDNEKTTTQDHNTLNRELMSRTFTENDLDKADLAKKQRGILFKVQILAKSSGPANIQELTRKYGIVRSIDEENNGDIYRYVAGTFHTYENAAQYANMMRERGISGAFVVAYKNGIRVPLATIRN